MAGTNSVDTRHPPTDTGRCGSEAGHIRHRRRGEQPCRPCQTATNAANERRISERRTRDTDTRPLPVKLGDLAGQDRPHRFRPMSMTQCADCYGWRDDPRHPVVGSR